MDVKDVKNMVKLKKNISKTEFPQAKINGFHNAIKNTYLLRVIEQI